MPTESFFQNYVQVVAGVRLCLDKKLLMPALILIYTLMDSFAWATSDKKPNDVRATFESWTENWVLKQKTLPCTATELFAARCAVLHTLTSEAKLTKTGKARKVTYAWGNADSAQLQATINALGNKNVVAIHVNDLFDAVCEAMAAVMEECSRDTTLQKRLQEAAKLHFVSMDKETVTQFLGRVHGV